MDLIISLALGLGERGELWLKGPNIMKVKKGYYNLPGF